MKFSLPSLRFLTSRRPATFRPSLRARPCSQCGGRLPIRQRRYAHTPADDPNFQSIVDNPPVLVKIGQRHGKGLIVLSIPISIQLLLHHLTAYSFDSDDRFRPGNLAGLQTPMEDRIDSQIRRSDTQSPSAIAATD